MLWARVRDVHGVRAFAQRAAAQLIRWESRHGWTRSGWGPFSQKEAPLAGVVAQMLTVPDQWAALADHYLNALDHIAGQRATQSDRAGRSADVERERRTESLAEWHRLLLHKLIHSKSRTSSTGSRTISRSAIQSWTSSGHNWPATVATWTTAPTRSPPAYSGCPATTG